MLRRHQFAHCDRGLAACGSGDVHQRKLRDIVSRMPPTFSTAWTPTGRDSRLQLRNGARGLS
jgi:hypothetical protein